MAIRTLAQSAVKPGNIDFSAFDSSAGHMVIGPLLIQWGRVSSNSGSGAVTVNLPVAYPDNTYSVTTTTQFNETSNASFWWAYVRTKSAGSFTAEAGYKNMTASGGGKASSSNAINWITIGLSS